MNKSVLIHQWAVIFDLDGTLIDTLDDIADSLNLALEWAGRRTLSRVQVRSLVGEGLPNLIRRASEIDDAEVLSALTVRYRENYRERMQTRTRPYPGIGEMLDRLTETHVPMCILSNKSHEFTIPLSAALLSRWSFVRVSGATDEAHRKPDPTMALAMAREMGRSPRDVFFVGDSDVDIETGRNAEMRTIAVTWGFRDREELLASRPDDLVDRPEQVVSIICGTSGESIRR